MRYTVDNRNESLGRKIRDASRLKIPVTIIVGPKDVAAQEVSIRLKDSEEKIKLASLKQFLENHE